MKTSTESSLNNNKAPVMPSLPTTMRAVQGKDYGPIDEMLTVEETVTVPPRLHDLPKRLQKSSMIVKVLSVALAPGDVRVLSGLTRELQGPPSFPYIPGGDCSGIVVELPPPSNSDKNKLPFEVGDRVACRFANKPLGCLAEYAIVSTNIADKVPPNLSGDEAAALASASPAVVLAESLHVENQRVLVMGARGGVGAHLCQLLKSCRGASYVVGVSSRPEDVLKAPARAASSSSSSVDECIDYTKEDVFSLSRFQTNKFDMIVDLSGYGFAKLESMLQKKQPLIVKTAAQGGRFVTFVPPIGPTFEIHGVGQLFNTFVFPLLWKAIVSRTFKRRVLPKYTFGQGLPDSRSCVTRTLALAQSGTLQAILDPQGPFPFTTEGVRAAFRNQESRHSWGKTVIRVSDDPK